MSSCDLFHIFRSGRGVALLLVAPETMRFRERSVDKEAPERNDALCRGGVRRSPSRRLVTADGHGAQERAGNDGAGRVTYLAMFRRLRERRVEHGS
jgi:hypothetical protein